MQDGHLQEAAFTLEAFGKEFILDVQLNKWVLLHSRHDNFMKIM